MKIWALADPHLSFGVPDKTMELFGPAWQDHPAQIEANWRKLVAPEDLVLVAGDLSWGMRAAEVEPDLAWLDSLPGKKILSRGNHDYWWPTQTKLVRMLPPSVQALDGNGLVLGNLQIAATRLWDTHEFSFAAWTIFRENPKAKKREESPEQLTARLEQQERIFVRELGRLEAGLRSLPPKGSSLRIAMTHYPPVGPGLGPSRASAILEKYSVDICVFGHLHSLDIAKVAFGKARGIEYILTSCDYINFSPKLIAYSE